MKYIAKTVMKRLKIFFWLILFNFITQKITTLINHKKTTRR